MTKTYRIASIPADGVGKEVIAAGRKVLDVVPSSRTGRSMMADDGLETLKDYDAIYFGAVGWADVPDHISLWGLRLNITQSFDLWANIRPVKFHPGIESPLRKADDTELDWVVVRENSALAGLVGAPPDLDRRTAADDRALDRRIGERLGTSLHASGTAPMRPADDRATVVDQFGRVHGISGLGIADTSILPAAPRRGPANTAVLIGEIVARSLSR